MSEDKVKMTATQSFLLSVSSAVISGITGEASEEVIRRFRDMYKVGYDINLADLLEGYRFDKESALSGRANHISNSGGVRMGSVTQWDKDEGIIQVDKPYRTFYLHVTTFAQQFKYEGGYTLETVYCLENIESWREFWHRYPNSLYSSAVPRRPILYGAVNVLIGNQHDPLRYSSEQFRATMGIGPGGMYSVLQVPLFWRGCRLGTVWETSAYDLRVENVSEIHPRWGQGLRDAFHSIKVEDLVPQLLGIEKL